MNKYNLLIIIFAFAIAYGLFSCNEKKDVKESKTENVDKKGDSIVQPINVLDSDTLTSIYDYSVTGTFDNGATRVVKFYDKNDTTRLEYEKHYYKTGQICMEGPLDSNGLRDGRWMAWYDCGKIWSEGDYTHGLRNGENKVYYVNGQVQYNKKYVNDTAEGNWTFYLDDGTEAMRVVYEKGKVIKQEQLISTDSLRNLSR